MSLPNVWSVSSFPKARAEAACLAFLRAVDAAEADAFSMVAVQYFEGITVKDGDDGAGKVPREFG